MASIEENLARLEQYKTQAAKASAPSAVVRRGDAFKTAFAGAFEDMPKRQAPSPGGWKGFVGGILDSPIGTVLKGAGEVLSVPGRVVTSGLKEFVDVIDTDPKTTASWDDFATQVKDPTFGFGTIAKDLTGNKWIDRAIGFIGDVALDPLTYVTLGTSKFAGAAGRVALGKMAADAGIDAAKVAKVVRYGRSALDAEDIASLGINKTGLYMFGKRIKGTGRIGEITEDALSNTRVYLSDTRMGRALQKGFTPSDFKELRLSLARGEVPSDRVRSALVTITSRNTQRQASARALVEGERRILELLGGSAGRGEIETVRKSMYKLMENPDLVASASPVVQQAYTKWRGLYDQFYDDIDSVMKEFGGENPFGFRENYFPRVETEAARNWRIKEANSYSKQMKEFIDDPLAPVGVFNPRKLKEGSEWFGTVLGKEDLNIDRLNELARAGGFKGDYFETDLLTVTQKYLKEWSDQMGTVARFKELNDAGVIKDFTRRGIDSIVVDKEAVAAQKRVLADADNMLKQTRFQLKDALQQAIETAVEIRGVAQTRLGEVGASATAAAARAVDDADVLARASAGVQAAEDMLDNYSKTLSSLIAADGSMPIAAGPTVRRIEELKQQLAGLRDNLGRMVEEEEALKNQLATAKGADRTAAEQARKAARSNRQKVLKEETQRFDDGVQAINDSINYNMLIANNYDAILNGTLFSGKDSILNDVAKWIGSQPLSAQKRGRGGIKPSVPGALDKYVKQTLPNSEWFKRLTRRSKVAPTTVAKVNEKTLPGSVAGLLDDPTAYLESGRASGMWAIARDEKVFAGDLPKVLQGARAELEEALTVADDVSAKTGVAAGTSRGDAASTAFYSELTAATDEAEDLASQLKSFNDIAETINSRGLADSDLPLSDQDKSAIADALMTQGRAASEAFGEADVADDVADIFDEYTPGLGADEAASMKSMESRKTQASTANAAFFSKAVSEAISSKIDTYKDLYRSLKRLENAVYGRQWKVGSGASEQLFTVRDAIVRLDSPDGMSRMRRSMANSEQTEEIRAAMVNRATPEQSALDVAEKVSMYYILSEVNQRFLALTATLAPVGGVATKEMLADLTANVTRPFLQMWEAHAKKLAASNTGELDKVQRVIGALKSFSENPAEDYFSVLLGDAGTRIRNSVPTSPTAGRSGLSKKAREAMDTTVDNLQSKNAEPLYLKSLSDKEMVDALDELSGYDLYNHTLPDGTRGFLVRGEDGSMDLLTMPDGSPLSFERAEWESLFVKAGTSNAEDVKRLSSVDAKIDEIGTRLERARSLQAQIERKRLNGTATAQDMKDLGSLPAFIRKAQDEINRLQEQAANLRVAVQVNDPAVRAAGLAKLRTLVQGNANQQGWFARGLDLGDIAHPNAADIATRRQNLLDAWRATPEGKVAEEVQAASARAAAAASDSFVNAPEAVAVQADRIIGAADEAARKAASAAVEGSEGVAQESVSQAARVAEKLQDVRASRKATQAEERVVARELTKLQKAMDSARDRFVRDATVKVEKATEKLPGLRETLTRAQLAFDQSQAVAMSAQEFADQVVPQLETTIRMVDEVINGTVDLPQSRVKGKFGPKPKQTAAPAEAVEAAPGRAAARGRLEAQGKTMKPKISVEEAAELVRWSRSARRALDMFGANPDDPLARVLMAASEAESRFLMAQVTANQERNVLRMLEKGNVVNEISNTVDKGFTELKRIGLPRKQMPQELAEVLTNVRQMKQPEVARFLNRFIGKYTRFFKAYATLSPGFHVRNAISNTVMVFASGANPANMSKGLDLYRQMLAAVNDGVKVDDWLKKMADELSPEEYKRLDIALRSMEAAGGGRTEEAWAALGRTESRVYDNPVTRLSKRVGTRVEGSARFMLGYDSAAKGLDFNAATARTTRYLFDYQDVGSLDETMRQIVPFWMWMSRNLPLQIVNQWTEPRTYAIYNQFMKNFGEDDSQDVVPKWLKDQGAIKIADNWYLSIDTGFNRVGETLELVGTPSRFLKDVNPILRVIPEVTLLDKKLYRGTPFSERAQEFAGGPFSPAVQALSTLLGQNRPLEDGSMGTTDKMNYAFMNFLPTAAQAERLIPSSEFYKNRQLGSALSYLGFPFRQVTDDARESELRRREREGE